MTTPNRWSRVGVYATGRLPLLRMTNDRDLSTRTGQSKSHIRPHNSINDNVH